MTTGVHILLVEDDPGLGLLLSDFLRAHEFVVALETDGARVARRVSEESPSMVVLDLMLPGLSGLAVLRQIRQHFRGAVLILTASKAEVDHIDGLELGADDFVTKPIEPKILLARVKSILRRTQVIEATATANTDPITVGPLTLDPRNRTVTVGSTLVESTSAEWALLWLLAVRAGHVVTREELYVSGLNAPYNGVDRGVDIHLSRIRKKLIAAGYDDRHLKSVRSVGYLLGA